MDKEMCEELNKKVEEQIKFILEEGIQSNNLDVLYRLIDIHKDVANEDYWNKKKEVMEMNYRGYGRDYGRENYGRRGRPMNAPRDSKGRYKGPEEKMHEMMEHYGNYSSASDAASRGNYGAEQDSITALEYMLEAVCDFMDMLERDAGSQEEVEMIKEYARKIGER